MKCPRNLEFESAKTGVACKEASAEETVWRALGRCSSAGRFLADAARAEGPITLLVNDGYRATMTRPAVAALARLVGDLPHRPRFRVVVATGTHTVSFAEQQTFVDQTFEGSGLTISDVSWHDADRIVRFGGDSSLHVHPWVAESRYLLPVGSIEPHYFAGVTGAHKTVTIGVLSRPDIERNHRGALAVTSGVLRLAGNPVHEGILDVLSAYRHAGKSILAINEIVSADGLLAAAAGDPIESLAELLPIVRAAFTYPMSRPFDLIRLKVPPPLGRSFYQADKALRNNESAVRDGGCVLLEAACPEGVGQDAFLRLLRTAPDFASAIGRVERDGYRLGDHKAVKLRYLMDAAERDVHVALVGSSVSPADASVLGVYLFETTEDALRWAEEIVVGPLARGLVVEDAGVVCAALPSAESHNSTHAPSVR